MSKLHIKFTHFIVSSVSLINDKGAESEKLAFSLRHIGVRKFCDGVGEFCTGEIKFSINTELGATEFNLNPDVFGKVEEYDQLQLVLYSDDKQKYCWVFGWPDTLGDSELDIELDLVTDGSLGEDEDEDGKGTDGEDEDEDGKGTDGEDEDGKGTDGEDEDGEGGDGEGDGPPWKRVGVIAVVAAAVVLIIGFIVLETGFLDQKLGGLSKKECTTRSYMIGAMETEETKSKFFDLCARNFIELTEREFGEVLADMTIDKSMLMLAGRFFDISSDDNFLKILRPNTQVNLPVAVKYYSEAKAANISGASELLAQACDKIDSGYDRLAVKQLCEITD